MIYTVVSAICIVIMFGMLVYFIAKFFKTEGPKRIDYIKNFKKGKFLLIYFTALPLYYMIGRYDGKGIIVSFFTSITKTVQLVVLKYDVSSSLYNENTVFKVAYIFCLSLVILNAMMVVLSLVYRNLLNSCRLSLFKRSSKDKCIIIGDNNNSMSVYRSCKRKKLLVDVISKERQEKLFAQGVPYKAFDSDRKVQSFIVGWLDSFSQKVAGAKLGIVVNCENEERNIEICGYLTQYICSLGGDKMNTVLDTLDIYVIGDNRYEELYFKYEQKAKGCLHFINQYRQIAVDFIDNFPMTRFMDDRHIDYTASLIKEGVDLNVVMLGFGKANRQLFDTMVANNQFMTADEEGKIVNKQVKYSLFDIKHKDENKCVNREYFRYAGFFAGLKENQRKDYLPLIDKTADEEFLELDLDDMKFYDKLRDSVSLNINAVNYIVISLGGDYLNIDTANKICAVLKEWKVVNCHVFIKVRNKKTFSAAKYYCDPELCVPYGEEDSVIYDFSKIAKEKFSEMAILRNFIYDVESDMKCEQISEEKQRDSRMNWYKKRDSIQRESNIYSVLSLRSKLNLIGLDYCDKHDEKEKLALSYDEYMAKYAKGDMPHVVLDDDGKTTKIQYPLDFIPSLRKNLAIQEHARWNAFMVMKGFVPAKIDEIINDVDSKGNHTNGRNFAIRHHGNLTSFEGLETFRQMIAARDNIKEEDCDVIKYDYQLMDGAWWILDKYGYKIVERQLGDRDGQTI